jgi:hypothetical protein
LKSVGLARGRTAVRQSSGRHEAVANVQARDTIPLRDGGVAWRDDHPRDAILQEIATKGLAGWKSGSGYHPHSTAETTMYWLKQLGDSLYSRIFERQVNEASIRAVILNTFTYLGMLQSVRVRQGAPVACERRG